MTRMNRLSLVLMAAAFLVAVGSAPALAATKHGVRVAGSTKERSTATATASTSGMGHYPKLEANLGLGMIFGGGAAGVGPAGSIGYSPAMIGGKFPLYVGAEVGFIFNFSPFIMYIPILPKAYMKFNVGPDVDLKAGIALGPVIGTSGAGVSFGFLFEPGLDLWLSRKIALNFDPKIGIYFSTFVFAPQVGVTIPL